MSNRPLFPDTTITRVITGIVATILTLILGWSINALVDIKTTGVVVLEDVEIIKGQQDNLNDEINVLHGRVDILYERLGTNHQQ